MAGDERRDAFLKRWSRLKREGGRDAGQAQAPAPQDEMAQEARADAAIPEDLENFDAGALDPETADFSRFVRDDVPGDIQRMALRKLWESDETLACMDGLNDYDEDFTPSGVAAAAADFMRRAAQWLEEEEEDTETASTAKDTPEAEEQPDDQEDVKEENGLSGRVQEP